MSANAYGKDNPPEDPPSQGKYNFRRVELLHKVMEQNRDGDKAIWFNEYGWNASPPTIPADRLPWGRVTSEEQAEYTVRGIEYAREHWPWAGVFTIWYLRQVGDIQPTQSEYYFQLVSPDFVPGAAFREVREIAHRQDHVAMPGEWGPLSPPVQARAGWELRLSPAVPGGVYVAPSSAISSDDTLEVSFQGTDVKLMLVPNAAAAAPSETGGLMAARYYVTIDGSSDDVSGALPRDNTGRAYIEIPADGQATEVVLAHGLGAEFPTGLHTLRLSVLLLDQEVELSGGGGRVAAPTRPLQRVNLPGIGAIRVEANRSYVLFTVMTLLLLAGIAVEAWALWRSRPSPQLAPAPRPVIRGESARGR
jgi:hypothetical protein